MAERLFQVVQDQRATRADLSALVVRLVDDLDAIRELLEAILGELRDGKKDDPRGR